MSDNWIKQQVISERYMQCLDEFGEVGADRLTRLSLADLKSHAAEYGEFDKQSDYEKMRRLVNSFLTAVRRSREAVEQSEDAGEMQLPGLEDVRGDHVAFTREGKRVRKQTMECGVEDLDAVIEGYLVSVAAFEKAVMFYIALRQHLVSRGVKTVRELYKKAA